MSPLEDSEPLTSYMHQSTTHMGKKIRMGWAEFHPEGERACGVDKESLEMATSTNVVIKCLGISTSSKPIRDHPVSPGMLM